MLEQLIKRGAHVQAYDPAAMEVARATLPAVWFESKQLMLAEHQYDALQNVDALALVTEWKPFCYPDLTAMKNLMRQRVIFDGRNQYDPKQMHDAGFQYYGIGRGQRAVLRHVETVQYAEA